MFDPGELDEPLRKLVRHDLRGPLGVIAGHCELLDEGLLGDLTERQKRSIGAIRDQVDRLEGMFDELAELVADQGAPGAPDSPSGPGRD